MALPNLKQLEQKIKSQLIVEKDVPKELNLDISPSLLSKYARCHDLEGLYFENGKDFTNGGSIGGSATRAYPVSMKEEIIQRIDSVREKRKRLNSSDYLPDSKIAEMLGVTLEELVKQIEDNKWESFEVESLYALDDCRQIYYFKKSNDLYKSMKFLSLNMIASVLGLHENTIFRNFQKGLFTKPKHLEGTPYWELEDFKKQLEEVNRLNWESTVKYTGNEELLPWNILKDDQLEILDRYLMDRKNGREIKWEEKSYYDSVFSKPEKAMKNHRKILSRFLLKILRTRNGFQTVKESGKDVEHIPITVEEAEKLDHSKLDLQKFDINRVDVRNYFKGFTEYTSFQRGMVVKPFLYWLLMELEQEYPVWRFDTEQAKEYYTKRQKLFEAVSLIPTKKPKVEAGRKRGKLFLSPKDIVRIYQTIVDLRNHVPIVRNWHEYAVMWMCGCFISIRPEELPLLRIEDFVLDENGFLRKINKHGYGLVDIRAEISKGTYSPSHPEMKTLIVPNLVELINSYLNKLYKIQDGPPGKGYLFRPLAKRRDPESRKLSHDVFKWIREHKSSFLSFLSEEQVEAMQFKSSRHTMNNLFDKAGLEPDLMAVKERARELQMRHDIHMTQGSTGRAYYTDEISPFMYFRVIDEVLNFPWNLKDLKTWETIKGYSHKSNVNSNKENVANLYDFDLFDGNLSKTKEALANVNTEVNKQIMESVYEEENRKEEDLKSFKDELMDVQTQLQFILKAPAKKLKLSPAEKGTKINGLRERERELKALLG